MNWVEFHRRDLVDPSTQGRVNERTMTRPAPQAFKPLAPGKFRDPDVTVSGARRASVAFQALKTLWFNTGTLCNLTCETCYIESSPRNDRLVYLTTEEVVQFLDEIAANGWTTEEIGFTGGEPFMNPHMMPMLEVALSRGFRVLVLTNAMRPMMKLTNRLVDLKEGFGQKLVLRVSLDHYTQRLHEMERGPNTWGSALEGLQWLSDNGFTVRVAARTRWGEPEAPMRRGFARLFAERGLRVNATDPVELVLFPEMDERLDVPEITEACWEILGVDPGSVMCATSRMVVKRKGNDFPVVVPCTLLPYDPRFEMGRTLRASTGTVKLNHPHCARFCVLGGGSCSSSKP